METSYLIEAKVAVMLLSVTLCIYLHVIFSETSSDKKGLLRYAYMTTTFNFIDLICSFVLAKGSDFSITTQYIFCLLLQGSLSGVYFMFMKYIAGFGPDTPAKKKLIFAQNSALGLFFYLMIAGHFTGANFRIVDGLRIEQGALNSLMGNIFLWIWSVWTFAELYIYRRAFTKGQLWALFLSFAICWTIQGLQIELFPKISVDFIIISVNVYYYFFLLETPAYRDLERTLERLRKAKELADEANRTAIEADKAKGEFLANMSHEIRTPLTTILGMDEVILRKYEAGPIAQYAQDIQSAGNTLLHIINDILDFSKIETGQLELALRNYDLGRVLRDVSNMVKIRAEQKGLRYIQQIDETLPNELFGDKIRVNQILVNILNNAVKYTKRGTVKFTLTGTRGEDPSTIILHITVADTGIGIHGEDIPKLFQTFSRIDAKETHNIEGTGLGLAIFTGRLPFIELMGGHVDLFYKNRDIYIRDGVGVSCCVCRSACGKR